MKLICDYHENFQTTLILYEDESEFSTNWFAYQSLYTHYDNWKPSKESISLIDRRKIQQFDTMSSIGRTSTQKNCQYMSHRWMEPFLRNPIIHFCNLGPHFENDPWIFIEYGWFLHTTLSLASPAPPPPPPLFWTAKISPLPVMR